MKDELNAFGEFLRARGRSENTISAYQRDVKVLWGWSSNSNGIPPHEAAQINLIYFRKVLKSSGKAFSSINRTLAAVNVYYDYLFETGQRPDKIYAEPFPIRNKKEFKGLEDKDLWKLRMEIHKGKNLRYICMFEMLLGTGVRVSELINIKFNDLEISERKGKLTVLGKGEVVRELPLNKELRMFINNYLEIRVDGSDYLFPSLEGEPFNRISINRILKRYGDRVGVKVSPHMLRHTLGYRLVRDKRAMTTIQMILGHSDVSTTNIYTMTTAEDMQEAMDDLNW